MSVELSVVVPIYDEQESVPELYRRLTEVLGAAVASYEVVMVDDGSHDRTWELIKELAARDAHVKGLSFSRNFGHQMAFTAGLDHVDGEAVVIMDGDLQDPPELIPELVARWREGYDVVYAVRAKRHGETAFKLLTAAAFYRLLRVVTNVEIPVDTGDFRLMSRKAVAAFRRFSEHHRFTRGMVSWLGFRQVGVPYARPARHAGETKYPLRKMLRLASDGITSFSYLPLQLATWAGVAVAGPAAAAFVAALVAKAAGSLLPWAWIAFAGLAFLGGLQLIAIGLLGEYVGRVFDDVRGRPLYLVGETVGFGPGERRPAPGVTA
ncbi:MAG: glycosyltransferase family 2 protein [Thermoanaerobaculaceae bacterium]|nr:glycosyltransferase family 2 protein [Thermoanaerobaculaceae bacterium]